MMILFVISAWFLLPQAKALAATYYVDIDGVGEDGILGTADDVISSDANPGTAEQPWKTLNRAYTWYSGTGPKVQEGDTVYLKNGNYGAYIEEPAVVRTDWITYKAAIGHTPVFTKIYIHKTSAPAANVYLKFDGIDIQHPAYTPTDDGYWHTLEYDANGLGDLVYTYFCSYLQFLNGHYQGYNKYLSTYGIRCSYGSNITIQGCETNKTAGGIYVEGGSTWGYNVTIKGNYVHDMCLGSGIRVEATNATNTLIEGNHVANQQKDVNDAYYPHEEPPGLVHIGSGLSIKTSHTTIRKNIVHGGFAEGMLFYDSTNGHHDMIIENNLFYDTGTVNAIYLNGPAIIRNNTSIGYIKDKGVGTVLDRYGDNTLNVGLKSGFNGDGVVVYNNICMTAYNLPSPSNEDLLFLEDYNIFWKESTTGSGVKGDHSKKVVWFTSPATGLHGFYDYFEDIGYETNTPEYTHINPPQAFFVDPNYYTGPVYSWGRYKIYDYHLDPNSPGINFGDPNNQPSDSLGSIGPDGFIRDDGSARDADHHSAGCYEYGATTFLYGDVNSDGEVTAYDAALTAQAAVDLITLSPEQFSAADVDGSKDISAYDAALIAQKAVGLIDKFPVE